MLFTRFILPGTLLKDALGSSQVPKEPNRTFALFSDPGRTSAPRFPLRRFVWPVSKCLEESRTVKAPVICLKNFRKNDRQRYCDEQR
jgi:hypothetical protein